LWHPNLMCKIIPVSYDSHRICAVLLEIRGETLLLISVYMPCDDRCLNQNNIEYSEVINDISILSNSVNANHVCIGGDFNTDFSRLNLQSNTLNNFAVENNLNYCSQDICCTVDYTFCSKGPGNKSFIDHFMLSENISDELLSFDPVESVNNFFSDHVAIKYVFECVVKYKRIS